MFRTISTLVLCALLAFTVAASSPRAAAAPTELFFSEYIEGTSNNKALEIYNGTGAPVDLGTLGYNVQMYFNGSASAGLTINLTGAVDAGDVYVLAQSAASAAILAQADQTNGAGWFNGDDAVVLRKGTTVIDVIGQIGFDPGTEWGSGLVSTADNTLRRKLAIESGDSTGGDAFAPVTEWDGYATDTFGGLGCHTVDTVCPPPPPPPTAEIWQIQGAGMASPVGGLRRRTEGNVVTAVFSDGFFIQTPGAGDADPQTSDGIFVFTGTAPTVAVGNQVTVTGRVVEFFNMTELNAEQVTVEPHNLPLPPAVTFDATRPSPNQPQPANEIERFEGMLVEVVNGTVTSPTDRFNEASVVASNLRPFREPGILFPGLPDLPVWDGNPEIFEIDTDRYAATPGVQLPAGATVSATGPLAFSFGSYQIWPTALSVSGGTAAVVPVRDRRPGEFTVGSQNFLRLFDPVNDPDTDDEVPSAQQYADRLAKFSLHVRQALKSPDVLAVQEVENLNVLQDVAARIAADDPALVYTAYLLEGNDIGGIDVGFLVRDSVRVDSVEQFGKADQFVFGSSSTPLNDRPPLVLRGAYTGGDAEFPITVINVHQRSLSGIESPRDGPRVRAKRHEQARRLSGHIQGIQAADPNVNLVVIGDFNAFEFTDGYVDVMGQVTGNLDPAGALVSGTDEIDPNLTNQTMNMPAAQRYSFVFEGTAQSLDHALTSQHLNASVRGAEHSRGNADAPAAFASDATTSLRSSDHDGTVLFVTSDADADSVPDNLDSCAATNIPEGVPTVELRPNHFALVDADGIFDTPAGRNTPARFTIRDTGGCSCEQILDRIGGSTVGERNFGCSKETLKNWISTLR